jgi:hypothetical protein
MMRFSIGFLPVGYRNFHIPRTFHSFVTSNVEFFRPSKLEITVDFLRK